MQKMKNNLDSEDFYEQLWFPMRDVYGNLQKIPKLPQSSLRHAAQESDASLMEKIVDELKNTQGQIFVRTMVTSASENLQRPQHFLPLSDFMQQRREYDVFHVEKVPQKVDWQQLRGLLWQTVREGRLEVATLLQEVNAFGWHFRPEYVSTLLDLSKQYWSRKVLAAKLFYLHRQFDCFSAQQTGLLPRHPLLQLSGNGFFVGCQVELTTPVAGYFSHLDAGTRGIFLHQNEAHGMVVLIGGQEWTVDPSDLRLVLPPLNCNSSSRYIQLREVVKTQSHFDVADCVIAERVLPPEAKGGLEAFEEGLKYLCDPSADYTATSLAQRQISELVLRYMPWDKLLNEVKASIDLETWLWFQTFLISRPPGR